jgi:hypothetical protein
MRVYKRYIDFYFHHRNESNSECFDNRLKTFVLHDNKLVNQRLNVFNFLENVSNDEFVNNRRFNHHHINLSDFNKDCVS